MVLLPLLSAVFCISLRFVSAHAAYIQVTVVSGRLGPSVSPAAPFALQAAVLHPSLPQPQPRCLSPQSEANSSAPLWTHRCRRWPDLSFPIRGVNVSLLAEDTTTKTSRLLGSRAIDIAAAGNLSVSDIDGAGSSVRLSVQLHDPCETDNGGCGAARAATCTSADNVSSCTCNAGYTGSPCRDINECRLDGNVCSLNGSLCVNSQGAFRCLAAAEEKRASALGGALGGGMLIGVLIIAAAVAAARKKRIVRPSFGSADALIDDGSSALVRVGRYHASAGADRGGGQQRRLPTNGWMQAGPPAALLEV